MATNVQIITYYLLSFGTGRMKFEFMQTIFKNNFILALDKSRASNIPSKMAVKVEMLYGHHL